MGLKKNKVSNNVDRISLLKQLGLTPSQATIYFTLCQSEEASAGAISRATKIHRSNVYRIITSLHSLGLVERRMETGKNLFSAMSLKQGIQLLLIRKETEYRETLIGARKTIEQLNEPKKTVLTESGERFDIIPKGKANLMAFLRNLEQASSSIDDVIAWKGFEHALNNSLNCYKKALKRGIKIRYITDFPEAKDKNVIMILNQIEKLQEIGSFEVRSITNCPLCVFAIFDRKKACICTFPIPNPIDTPALWSNNMTLVRLTQTYFNLLWKNTKEPPTMK